MAGACPLGIALGTMLQGAETAPQIGVPLVGLPELSYPVIDPGTKI